MRNIAEKKEYARISLNKILEWSIRFENRFKKIGLLFFNFVELNTLYNIIRSSFEYMIIFEFVVQLYTKSV